MPSTHPSVGIFAPRFRLTTIGILTAIVTCAFDQTAVTAVMPHIAHELGDSDAYSLTFVAVMAASIVGMVSSGLVTDSRGARFSYTVSAITLGVGLLAAVFAPNMLVFLISRAIQGLGTGGLIVAVYAIIAQVYPKALRPKVFAAFAVAWIMPALVGPGIAGLITTLISWHAVFVLALVTVAASIALLSRALIKLPHETPTTRPPGSKQLLAAFVLAAAGAGLSLASQTSRELAPWCILIALGTALFALRQLTPRGTLQLRRGVPRLVATRGLVDMFFAAEMYLPLMLAQTYRLGPSLTGIALTISGICWLFGSHYQSRFGARIPTPLVFRVGSACMALGTLWIGVIALGGGHWGVAVAGWAIAAVGIGFIYPRLSSKPLELCPPEQTGFTGSALQVTGTTGTTVMLSLCSLIQVFGSPITLPSVFVLIAAAALPLLVMWRPAVPEPRKAGPR